MEFEERNKAGKVEIWRVENGIRKKVMLYYML
jgi:hypothetical protein